MIAWIGLPCLMLCGGFVMAQTAPTATPDQSSPAVPARPPGLPENAHWPPTPEEMATYQKAQDEQMRSDWPNLKRYQQADAQIGKPAAGEKRVVFYGDSITDSWINIVPEFFQGRPYLDRGISGQTTPQMLVRFRQDVVDLHPKVVVILAGTNDIAGNTGPSTPEMIEDNLKSMVELAQANGIKPVLASILPASDYWWKPGVDPGPKIAALNAWIKDYAQKDGLVYVDYYSAMVNNKLGLPANLSPDGVHPNRAGYAIMAPLAEKAIDQALANPPSR
jgi:lysophospholipase L1-like esterase